MTLTEPAITWVTLPGRPRPRAVATDALVVVNRLLTDRYWLLRLGAAALTTAEPGQFAMVTVTRDPSHGPVLPRPMAIYDVDHQTGSVDIVYSVGGEGTRALAGFAAGERLGVVGPLGRGFDAGGAGHWLLLGRGIGTCSMTLLARHAAEAGRPVTAVASGRHRAAVLGADLLRRAGADVIDVDDAAGTSRPDDLWDTLTFRLDADPPSMVATCGSARLQDLAARLAGRWGADAQVSVEARMACGLGYCHGCSTGGTGSESEAPLVCRDGPVFGLPRALP